MLQRDICGKVSFVIAVVGHRDLYQEDEQDIRDAIREFLCEQRKQHPGTDLLLLTGMAEGADCLAAEVARELAVEYTAVLPFEPEPYFQSFTAGTADHARELIAAAKQTIVLPPTKQPPDVDWLHDAAAQARQYEALSSFLVQASHILLAIYDPRSDDSRSKPKPGGTGDSISFKLGIRPVPGLEGCSGLNNAGVGPVHYILVRRKQFGDPRPLSSSRPTKYPGHRMGANEEGYRESYKLQDAYNCAVEQGRHLLSRVAEARRGLYPGIDHDKNATKAMVWTADRYAWADTLALQCQHGAARLWRAIFILLALAFTAFVSSHTIDRLQHNFAVELTYYGALATALALGRAEQKHNYRRKHEDYRALAEALRIQYFWLACRLDSLVAEFYLTKQTGEMAWVRDAMSGVLIEQALTAGPSNRNEIDEANIGVALAWVDDQKAYHKNNAGRSDSRWKFCYGGAIGIFLTAFLLQLGYTIWYHISCKCWGHATPADGFEQALHLVATVLIGYAALLRSYGELNTYAQSARQDQGMYQLFSIASALLEADDERRSDPEARQHARHVVEELGKAALQESGDWLIMHRERHLDIMLSGS